MCYTSLKGHLTSDIVSYKINKKDLYYGKLKGLTARI
jgi:hypothetical protein